MIGRYRAHLSKRIGAHVLDVGPVCSENINYFIRQARKVFICDLFLRLDNTLRRGGPSAGLPEPLDYPGDAFYGIHLWDLCDRLPDAHASLLLGRTREMLGPGGWVIATAYDERSYRGRTDSFVIDGEEDVRFRHQTHLDLPFYHRANRDMQLLFKGFVQVDSFVYTGGLREFIFRRT
jgi:hypothetical protein